MKILYFIAPDSKTNRVIVTRIGEQNVDQYARNEVHCSDGVSRNMWELPKELVNEFISEVDNLKLVFNVYRQFRGGKVRFWMRFEPKKTDETTIVCTPLPGPVSVVSEDKDPPPF